MTEELLDRAQIAASLEHVRRVGVAQRVRAVRIEADFIGSFSCVASKTLSSFSLSKTISSRLRPVRLYKLVNSIASTGQASSHIPQ